MNQIILLIGIVIVICVLLHHWIEKLPVPSLLIFLGLGMIFGENGILKISFDNYVASEIICSACLIFIIYYGGFGVNLKAAKTVIKPAIFLSTLGVALTAVIVGIFAHFIFDIPMLQGLLIGSLIASTDAASVFSVLRSQKLSLKYHTDSLLELESGSNDPISYMLTVVLTTLLLGDNISISLMLLSQIIVGALCGIIIAKITIHLLNRLKTQLDQATTILVVAAVLIAYALPTLFNGNGYLSVYICGILMGNSEIPEKRNQAHFFDTLTGIAQMLIFFLLGLLVTPAKLPEVFIPSLIIMLFLTFIARPLAVSAILMPFKAKLNQILLVSWSGLRGVASIVFAIYVVTHDIVLPFNIFNLVFCIVLMSIAFQGTGLPFVAKKFKMIDEDANVQKTFNDYQENSPMNFLKVHIEENDQWENKYIKDLTFPKELLIAIIIRNKHDIIVPSGDTLILKGDLVVLAGHEFDDRKNLMLQEITIDENHKWNNKALNEINIDKGTLIVMLERNHQTIVPSGDTVILENDTLVIAQF